MNRNDIIQLLKDGHVMHCQFVNESRVWWMQIEGHHIPIPDQMAIELTSGEDPAMRGLGDSLFGLENNDQTFSGEK